MIKRAACLAVLVAFPGCSESRDSMSRSAPASTSDAVEYVWERLTEHAAFPPSYNFPVHLDANGRFVALHPEGTWTSEDGVRWSRGFLPFSGMNSAYLKYVKHNGATWALGTLRGNYESFFVVPEIRRTADYESWEPVGTSDSLPQVVFYAAVSFRGDIWLLGGYDGAAAKASIWRSSDGLAWRQVMERAPWSPRQGAGAIVFRDRLYLFGGGELDGPQFADVWSTADGIDWRRETERISDRSFGGSAIVFDGQLWFIGVNRDSGFSPGVLVSDDGIRWRERTAPWAPRGAVAVWTNGVELFMTGGKYSTVEQGETVFTYYNDVWRMRRSTGR